MNRKQAPIALFLAGVGGSLLLVGVVSATLVRHVVQIAPIVVVLTALATQPRWGAYAAMPIFGIWLLLMVLIWLYLLGVGTFFTGTFSRAELVLTILIGVFAVIGIQGCMGSKAVASIAARTVIIGVFGALQIGALWISFLDPFRDR